MSGSLVGECCDDCGKPFGRNGAWCRGFERRCDECELRLTTDPIVREIITDFAKERTENRK